MHRLSYLKELSSVLFVLAIFQCVVKAQDEDPITMLKTRTNDFFDHLADAKFGPKSAFNNLLADGPLEERDVKKLIDRIQGFKNKYGEFVDVEPIGSKQVGKDLVMLTYLYKMKRFPVVWFFTFYRQPNSDERTWVVIAVRFSTRLDLLWEPTQ